MQRTTYYVKRCGLAWAAATRRREDHQSANVVLQFAESSHVPPQALNDEFQHKTLLHLVQENRADDAVAYRESIASGFVG